MRLSIIGRDFLNPMKTETQPKTAGELLPEVLARLERTYGAGRPVEPTSEPSSTTANDCEMKRWQVSRPLATPWQRKWLNLDVTRPQIQDAANIVEKWAARFARNKKDTRLLVIVGDYGVGKTEIAEHLKRWSKAVRSTIWGMGWTTPPRIEFVEFGKVAFLETAEFRNWLEGHNTPGHETDLMFLEDIGAEVDKFRSGEPTERLREIFNDMKNRFMVVTTNVPSAQWETRWDGRIMDRLMRHSEIIEMTGVPSYQQARMPYPND